MKIALGVESAERAAVVGGLVKALGFPGASTEVLHVLERLAEDRMPPPAHATPDLITRFLQLQEDDAKAVLSASHKAVQEAGLPCTSKLLTGFAANALLAHAEKEKVDVLALGSTGRGALQSALLGGVGRKALTSAKCSVLIAKKAPPAGRPLTAVFATDHSEYANRCLETFVSWQPKGIGRVVVTTVYPEQLVRSLSSLLTHFKADVSAWVKGELERNNDAALQKLAKVVPHGAGRVESGDVGDTLARVMQEEEADLLILGAQGHGFMERLFVGSISLDQAMGRPYSTLVVRA